MDIETLLSYPWRIMLPEFTILGVATILSLLDLFMREKVNRNVLAWIALAGIGLALSFVLVNIGQPTQHILYDTFRLDGFANGFKLIFLIATAMIVLNSIQYVKRKEIPDEGEFYYLMLAALLGAMMMASSADLITLFVGLELLSISSYILVGTRKKNLAANESAFKYIVNGGIATSITLFGFSYIYGLTGSSNLFEIAERLLFAFHEGHDFLIYFAFLITFVGLAFKISVVPFHMWTPDVYQGAPTPVTAFLAVVSKAAGFALIIRLFLVSFFIVGDDTFHPITGLPNRIFFNVEWLLAIAAALSMIIGNTLALRQGNIKRMFAYSSIAQAGYILVPLALSSHIIVMNPENIGLFYNMIVFYIMAYLLMNLGAFTMIQLVTGERNSADIHSFAGLHHRSPWKAFAMTVFLISLAGLPITAGFMGKFYIFMGSLQAGKLWLAAVMIITSVVSYFYYFAIIRQMYLRPGQTSRPLRTPVGMGIVLLICVVGTVAMGIFPHIVMDVIHHYFDFLQIFEQVSS